MEQEKPVDLDEAVLVDCIDLKCPLPVLRARKMLKGLRPGALIRLESTDPMAVVDVPHMVLSEGHRLERKDVAEDGARATFWIRRGSL